MPDNSVFCNARLERLFSYMHLFNPAFYLPESFSALPPFVWEQLRTALDEVRFNSNDDSVEDVLADHDKMAWSALFNEEACPARAYWEQAHPNPTCIEKFGSYSFLQYVLYNRGRKMIFDGAIYAPIISEVYTGFASEPPAGQSFGLYYRIQVNGKSEGETTTQMRRAQQVLIAYYDLKPYQAMALLINAEKISSRPLPEPRRS